MLEAGFYNKDCTEELKNYPDQYFDLCIADPPYGGGFTDNGGCKGWFTKCHQNDGRTIDHLHSTQRAAEKQRKTAEMGGYNRFGERGSRFEKYRTENKTVISWDVAPGHDFFNELFRVSKNQIIWGGNYFDLPPTRCFLVWRKLSISENFSMAMCEYAWTSFNGNAKVFECAPQDPTGQRFHPTQKPVKLYEWILDNYAKPGDRILDPMAGSGSCLVACRNRGYECTGFEIDQTYYEKAKARIDQAKAQMNIFDFM